jgi:uncharacterized protein involved in exopolysaccharide biosynthesis
LSSTPQNLITRRAISDDAVWQALAGGTMSPEQRQRFLDQGMIAENPNPAWTDLTTRVANLEIDLAALAPREERLRADIQSKSERLKDDEALLRADIAAFSELQRGREVGLAALVENQELSLAALKRDRDIAIQGFARQSDLRLAILDRELVQAKGLYDQFAKHQSEAQIAKAQENRQDVQLATPAVAPDRPESAKRGLIAVAAVFAGLMLGLCHAVVRGALRTGR